MTTNDVHAIGYVAQGLFASRFIIQWIQTEKAGKIQAPTLFWQVSLIASFLLIFYSILIRDLTVLAGQALGYFVYIRNLRLQKNWRILPQYFRYFVLLVPFIAFLYLIFSDEYSFKVLWHSQEDNLILFWGITGQIIFSCRFIYQWYFSEKIRKSVLPLGFWILSVIGSLIIASYSIYEGLYPILIGHIFGLIIYSRNITIYYKNHR